MSDGTPFELRAGEVSDPEELILKFFYEVNPEIGAIIADNDYRYKPILKNIRRNLSPNNVLKYNTIVEVHPDGCLFSNEIGKRILFSYGRWDIARLAFKETGTIGVPDVPFQVESNTKEGIKKAFYGLIDDALYIGDHPQFPGVKEWRGIVKDDNPVCIYTQWVGDTRVYYNEFVIFAKAYKPENMFEDSDFVE